MKVIKKIGDLKLIPVAVIEAIEKTHTLGKTLLNAGLPIIEVTFRTMAAADCISILKKEFLVLLPQNIIQFATFIVTFLTSIFYTILADALYLGHAKAYFIGIALHSYSAVTSVTLWILGINTLKLIGVFLFSMNTIKAVYLYARKNKRVQIDEVKQE